MLYFDHNATAPLCAAAREAWLDATKRFVGNPSSPHRLGARADAALEEAREKLARILGCSAAEIIWTSGATESANMAIRHAALATRGEAWISGIEHPCVLAAAKLHFAGRMRIIPVTTEGVVDLEWLRVELETSRPGFIAVMAANNETGVLQPWREVLALSRACNVQFLCDAAQWIGKLPACGLGECVLVSGCGHKFGGPQGVGFLKGPADLRPLLVGGSQEDGRRAGTENVAGILAMIAALEAHEAEMQIGWDRERLEWRAAFETELVQRIPGSRVLGADFERLWNTCAVIMPPAADCRQRWLVKLDKLGFAVSTGSACASGKEAVSHVLQAMRLMGAEASRALRFSSGWETRKSDWVELLHGVQRAHTELSAGSPASQQEPAQRAGIQNVSPRSH